MSWLTNFIRPKVRALVEKRNIPETLWHKCSSCEQMVFQKDLENNFNICRHCGFHEKWPVRQRISSLFDEGNYTILDAPEVKPDPLKFKDKKKYSDRLKEAKQKTNEKEAILLVNGLMEGHPLVAAFFNFEFIGGSMGMAVGEALLKGATLAVKQKAPYLVVPASGGARMQEGILSLMQMPRSVLAVSLVKEAGLPFLTLLTNPTTGGVAASFAALGDIILAEPGAIIGFAGARVLSETLRQPLPSGFQTSEFQRDHGFVDLIVSRPQCRETLKAIMGFLLPSEH